MGLSPFINSYSLLKLRTRGLPIPALNNLSYPIDDVAEKAMIFLPLKLHTPDKFPSEA